MIPLIPPLAIALTSIIAVVYITYCYASITAKNGDLKCVSKYPPISIVFPAYNEEKAIEGRIKNIAQSMEIFVNGTNHKVVMGYVWIINIFRRDKRYK